MDGLPHLSEIALTNFFFLSATKGVFICFGLSGAIPAVHYAVQEGWMNAFSYASLGWLILTGALYILGALLYAGRIPERYFPGKCDIWVSHLHNLSSCLGFFLLLL